MLLSVRSLPASRSTNSGLAPPAPDPAPSGSHSMPSAPLVPPNPNGETGSTSVSDATRCVPGRSTRYCRTTPPPMLQPTRWTVSRPRASIAAARSSEKSRSPWVAITGSSSVSPKPRKSMASGLYSSGRASIVGCQNSEDDTFPCTNSTGVLSGVRPVLRPATESTLTVRRLVGIRSAVMPGSSVSMGPPAGFGSARLLTEAVAGLAEAALGEREDLGRADLEHQRLPLPAARALEGAVADLELPLPVPLSCPGLCEPGEEGIVGHPYGVAFGHHVEPLVPPVAAGQQQHVRVAAQVDGLLLAVAGAEVERSVQPHGHQRGEVGPAVGTDRAGPGQLGLLEHPAGFVPAGGRCVGVAEPLVECGVWFVHRCSSLSAMSRSIRVTAARPPAVGTLRMTAAARPESTSA